MQFWVITGLCFWDTRWERDGNQYGCAHALAFGYPVCLAIWFFVLLLSRYVSLASMIVGLLAAPVMLLLGLPKNYI